MTDFREFKVEANVGRPQVAYKETIRKSATSDLMHVSPAVKVSTVMLRRDLTERTYAGFVFENTVVGGAIPKEYIPAVEAGVKSAMNPAFLQLQCS
ncbi:MAG: hypothetical protein ACLUFM_05270 [Lachnospiraceae bacterium]